MLRTRGYRLLALVSSILLLVGCVTMEKTAESLVPLKTSRLFLNNMVLQREVPVPVWGTGHPGLTVEVRFRDQVKRSVVDEEGRWMVWLDPMEASTRDEEMTISYVLSERDRRRIAGEPEVRVLRGVLVGDVWLCAGQSNMEMGMAAIADRDRELEDIDYPHIRLYLIPKSTGPFPERDVPGAWFPSEREYLVTGGWFGFSAVAYTFGRKLHKELGVPIGLIQAAYGGSPIHAWIPEEELRAFPELARYAEMIDEARAEYEEALKRDPAARHPWEGITDYDKLKPATIYNAMVAPLVPLALKGVIWYQGESDVGDGPLYTVKMRALIQGLRRLFGDPALPFYFAQIAPWDYGTEGLLPRFWEAQAAVLEVPHTGMAPTVDVGDPDDIHPRRKREVGERLALLALHDVYGREDIDPLPPTAVRVVREPSGVRVVFAHAERLVTHDGNPPREFSVVRSSGEVVPAAALIEGQSVLLQVEHPEEVREVRYAWRNTPEVNLFDESGLPAMPFSLRVE